MVKNKKNNDSFFSSTNVEELLEFFTNFVMHNFSHRNWYWFFLEGDSSETIPSWRSYKLSAY